MSVLTQFQRISYASGAFTKSLQWNSSEFLLLYFLAEVQGIGAGHAGGILLLSMIWAGVLDIIIARLFDKYNVNYQRVIAWSIPFCVVTFGLLFWPVQLSQEQKPLYYIVTILLFRIGYTLIDIPHNALLSVISTDSKERTSLSAYRIGFNSFAVFAFAILSGDILALLSSENRFLQERFIVFVSLLFAINLLISVKPIWDIEQQSQRYKAATQWGSIFKTFWHNKPFIVLVMFTLFAESLMAVFYKSSVYIASIVLHDEQTTTGLLIGLAAGKIIAMPLFSYLMRFLEKQQAVVIACLGQSLCVLAFYIISPETLWVAGMLFLLCGIFLGALHMLVWAAIPDTIEYGKFHFGVANNALTFGIYHLFMRLSNGLSFGLLTVVLIIAEQQYQNVSLKAESLILWTTLITGTGGVIGIIIIRHYLLNHATHQQIVSEIQQGQGK